MIDTDGRNDEIAVDEHYEMLRLDEEGREARTKVLHAIDHLMPKYRHDPPENEMARLELSLALERITNASWERRKGRAA